MPPPLFLGSTRCSFKLNTMSPLGDFGPSQPLSVLIPFSMLWPTFSHHTIIALTTLSCNYLIIGCLSHLTVSSLRKGTLSTFSVCSEPSTRFGKVSCSINPHSRYSVRFLILFTRNGPNLKTGQTGQING